MAKSKKTAEEVIKEFYANRNSMTSTTKSNNKPASTKNDKGKQNNSASPTKKTADETIKEFYANRTSTLTKKNTLSGNAPFKTNTTKKYSDYNTETKNAYTSVKDRMNSKTTIKSNLTDDERNKRIKEIKSELTTLNTKLSGYSRASAYGTSKAMTEAKNKDEARIVELKQELKNLERVGTFSASELKQFEIDDAKAKVSSARQKVNSFGARPTLESAEAYKQANSELYDAQNKLDELEKQKELYGDISKFGDVVNEDTFTGQWRANYRSNELNREADKAISRYLDNPTEENKELAYAYDAFAKEYAKNNEKALDDENVKASWLTKSAAGYLPQFKDQIVPEAIGYVTGGILGLGVGVPTVGASIGAGIGSGIQSYNVMRGSVYRTLLAEGVDEETALQAANDEALISSLIEGGESALSVLAMGGTKAIGAIMGAAKSSVAKGSTNVATKFIANLATKSSAKAATKAAAGATRPLWRKGLGLAFDVAKQGASEYLEEFTQGAVSKANQERALNGNVDGKWQLTKDSSGVMWDAVTGKDPETLAELHEQGWEGAKIGLMFGGTTATVNNAVANYANTRTIANEGKSARDYAQYHIEEGLRKEEGTQARTLAEKLKGKEYVSDIELGKLVIANKQANNEQYFSKAKEDADVLDALVEEGKSFGGQAKKIAEAIEKKTKAGKDVSVTDIKKLVAANEVYSEAEETTTETDPLEQAAMDVVNERNRVDGIELLEARKRGEVTPQMLERLSQVNAEITNEEAKKATGFGDRGAELVAKAVNTDGATFYETVAEVRPSYLAGFNNPDMDIKKVAHTFDSQAQQDAYTAGQQDAVMQNRQAEAKAKNARVFGDASGVIENEYSTQYSPRQMRMADTIGKDLGSQVSFEERLIANEETGYEANAYHENGEIKISNTSESKFIEDIMEESLHRMSEIDTEAVRVLKRATYEFITEIERSKGTEGFTFDEEKALYDNAGQSINTRGIMEEVSVGTLSRELFKDEKQWLKWRERLDTDSKLRQAWYKLMDIVSDIIEKIERLLAEKSFSKETRAKVNKEMAELKRLKGLYTDAYVATRDAVAEKTNNQNTETRTEAAQSPVASESKSVNKETPSKPKNKPQTKSKAVKVGETYTANATGKTYTITERSDTHTTYTVTDKNGKTTTRKITNTAADINFNRAGEEGFTKVKGSTGIKVGDVFTAKGTTYKIVSRDAMNTKIEISSKEGTQTMLVSNEVADNNFINMSKEGVTKWIDEDMHIDNRTWEDVGDRKVKAFQFLFPEMKEYYTPLAQELLGDLDNTIEGERIKIGSYDMNNEEWVGVSRYTSEAIATIKDSTNATYDDIRNALHRLINDEGQENIALAKRIELVFDDMLTNGYTTFDGTEIEANEEYITKKEALIGKTYEKYVPSEDEELPYFSLKDKDKKTDKKSSNNYDVIDLTDEKELSRKIKNTQGAEKYKIIRDYILETLGEEPVVLSDGIVAKVDRSDALHIANKSANQKVAHISKIKDIIKQAKFCGIATDVEHKKFDAFRYYKANVKYGEEMYPVYLNVGRAKNGDGYHIYDITKKIGGIAKQNNALERVENDLRSENDSPISSKRVSQDPKFVKGEFSATTDEGLNGSKNYSLKVADKKTIDFLENQEHITTYKAMQLIDGKLYPPMAAKTKGEDGKYHLTNASEIGSWQQAVEDPSNIQFNEKGVGYYVLNKGDGSSVKAAYNPYEHSSNLVLNDQFESAHRRNNLVTVECVIPKSEMTSGYKAQYAKDTTGVLDWKSGVVAGQIKDNKRMVYLSRWLKPVRILSDAETATMYKEALGNSNVSVPFNVVTPSLLSELEKLGVSIDYEGSPMYKSQQERNKAKSKTNYSLKAKDQEYLELAKDPEKNEARLREMVEEAARNSMPNSKITTKDGKLRIVFHGTNTGDFTVFNPDYIGMSSGDDGFFGMGFYFAYSEGEASYYGANRVIPAYLNLKNPFNFDKELQTYKGKKAASGYAPDAVAFMNFADKFPEIAKNITVDVVEKDSDTYKELPLSEFSKAFKDVIDNKKFKYQELTNEYGEKETLVTADPQTHEYEYNGKKHKYKDYGFQKRFWGKPNDLDVAYEYLANSVYSHIDMYNKTRLILDNNREFTNALKNMGYDGTIQSEFGDEAVAFSSEQIKSAEPVTYDDNGKVIPLSERFNTKNDDIRYSLKDSEGKSLTKEQAEYFKDSKVRDENGNLLVVYHGSPAKFTVFNHNKINAHGNAHGRGFYFTSRKSFAEGYKQEGGQLLKGYLNITNPLSEDKVTIKKAGLLKLIKATCKEQAQEYVRDEGYDSLSDALRDTWISNYVDTYGTSIENAYREVADIIYRGNTNDVEMVAELTNAGAGTENTLRLAHDILGYDGVIYENEEGHNEFVSLVSNQFKDVNNTNPTSNPDINFSLKGGISPMELLNTIGDAQKGKKGAAEKLAKYVESGMIRTKTYDELVEKYGVIPSGERPHREVQVPRKTEKNKKVSQTVRTILEAKATPDEAVPTIEKMVEDGIFSYDVYTDKQAIADSEAYIKEYGWDESLDDWFDAVNSGEVSKELTTMGWALYNNAANIAATTTSESERTTAIKTSLKILDAMVRHQRSAAQALQATRILKKLSPETQLYGVQKSVQALQNELTEKYGDKAPNLTIDEELAEEFINAKTPEERAKIEKEIYKDIGRQMPSHFIDKWNAWRYLAMLGNPRTHIRNIVGNMGFAPIVGVKNLTATAIESAVSSVVRWSGKEMVRGKSLVWGSKTDRALLSAAWNDYSNVADMISNGGKYNDSAMANQNIQDGRRIFKFKPLEWARKGNSQLLEMEDMWFSKPHYAYALAQYCKANNITAEQISRGRAIAPARDYAIKEAQKATYRDTNAFSQMVSSWGRNKSCEEGI